MLSYILDSGDNIICQIHFTEGAHTVFSCLFRSKSSQSVELINVIRSRVFEVVMVKLEFLFISLLLECTVLLLRFN